MEPIAEWWLSLRRIGGRCRGITGLSIFHLDGWRATPGQHPPACSIQPWGRHPLKVFTGNYPLPWLIARGPQLGVLNLSLRLHCHHPRHHYRSCFPHPHHCRNFTDRLVTCIRSFIHFLTHRCWRDCLRTSWGSLVGLGGNEIVRFSISYWFDYMNQGKVQINVSKIQWEFWKSYINWLKYKFRYFWFDLIRLVLN